jgi:hypothetical protein
MDFSHVMKKIRNDISKSGKNKYDKRNLTHKENKIYWEHWRNAYLLRIPVLSSNSIELFNSEPFSSPRPSLYFLIKCNISLSKTSSARWFCIFKYGWGTIKQRFYEHSFSTYTCGTFTIDNIYDPKRSKISIIMDFSHVMKKIRNNISKSGKNKYDIKECS